ncbi:uracil-DNA glycosylase [Myxococcota bacterium]|nr:uracil-DNA glycosylase [Myxococcota bacterium]
MTDRAARPDCLHCVHYYVTWDTGSPRGCRAYEFKSSELPSEVVLASSGAPCQLFERKPERPGPTRLVR